MTDSVKLEDLMDAKQLAPILGITTFLLTRMAKDKKLPATKVGNRWLFCKEKVERYINDKMEEV